ncbi:MAG: hypothetical protein RL238_2001 [Actinomycetota bacterium]
MDVTDTPGPSERVVDLDVIRAFALIGVCVMNYHGYLILRGGDPGDGFLADVFDPWTGPLSTRFAATFVTVAGMGVALMSRRALAGRDPAAVSAVRWTLIRRGVLLFAFGFVLDWIWSGTILFFYGAYFLVGAAIFTLRSRWIAAIGVGAAVGAAMLQWWGLTREDNGNSVDWLFGTTAETNLSPRDLLLDALVRGTHPLLPWLVFFCMGIVLGRALPFNTIMRVQLAFFGVICVAAAYLSERALPWRASLRSTHPFDRGILYSLAAVGTSLIAVVVIGAVAQATASSRITQALAVTGRTTLTLYVLHVLVFNLVVDWLDWVQPGGLGTALAFAVGYWVVAIVLANLWHRTHEHGPLEWVYRRFSA